MVQEEENWVITEDLIEALMIILKSQSDKEKFEAVLGFISETVVEIIEKEKLDLLSVLLQSLHKLFIPESSSLASSITLHVTSTDTSSKTLPVT